MPLPTIDITDLPDAGVEDPKDHYALQRQVLGTWQDFYTEAETLNGAAKIAVIEWDMSGPLFGNITPETPGNYLVFLRGFVAFTPGGSPTASLAQVQVFQGSSTGQYIAEFTDGTVGSGIIIYPATDPIGNPYSDLDQDINVFDSGGGPYSGTARIVIQYVEKQPI